MTSIAQIQFELQKHYPEISVFCFDELDSTNHYLKQYATKQLKPAFCFSSSQNAGYGQQSRAWQSDFSSITFSLLLHINTPLKDIDGLTQLVALKLVESLTDFSMQDFKLKWPNDLYVDKKKAGGILIECVSFSETDCWLVVGVGLNNGLSSKIVDPLTGKLNQPGSINLLKTDILDLLNNVIAKQLILADRFERGLFKAYSVNYALVDFFKLEQSVIVYDSAIKQLGLYKGLTDNGELLVEIEGTICTFRSGMTSIRPISNEHD